MNEPAKILSFRRPPPRKPNRASRPRDYLWESEVECLISACPKPRDGLLILLMYRHGLRTVEAVNLLWSDIHWERKEIYVRRAKGSEHSCHPLSQRELGMLEEHRHAGRYVFGHGEKPLSRRAVRHVIAQAGKRAAIGFHVNAHSLRHACGTHLSAQGADLRVIQAYLGHRDIKHTVRYVALASNRFKEHYWGD